MIQFAFIFLTHLLTNISRPFTRSDAMRHYNSLKESVYKALHPILCQYIGFQEAEITPFTDGTAKVTLNLLSGSHERLGIVVHTASWRKMGDYFLTSASVGVMPLTIQRSILI